MFKKRQGLFFIENPALPIAAAVRHSTKDDLGDLEARLAETTARIEQLAMHSSVDTKMTYRLYSMV